MSKFNPLLWPKPPVIWRYGIAVLSVAVALTITWWPSLHLHDAPVSLLLCAVMFSAWFGGLGPGLLAVVLSVFAFDYYFLPPMGFGAKAEELPRFLIFAVSAMFVGSLSAAQRSATESLRRAHDELNGKVQELRRTNETLQAESRERKHAEEKLRQSEAYLHEAQKLGHIGSWALNVSSGVFFASPELLRILGRDPETDALTMELLGESIHPEDRPSYMQMATNATSEKINLESNYRVVLPDGSIKHVHSVAQPVFSDSGNLVEYVATIMDVTERKQAEEDIRQAQADLAHVSRVTTMGELTASLAHEVNQPIAAAVTNANACMRWLGADTPNLDEARAAAMRIVRDGTRAAEIISRIRLLFQKGPPERELVDVDEVIREMIVLLRGETTRHSISVRTDLAPDLPPVMGDRVQLQQVLMNLLINGIDAMKDVDGRRELAIKVQSAGNQQLLVSVSDTGVGIPPQQADKIFNAFYTTKLQGTGMGLSISRSIVESHGGRLWTAHSSPRGTSFQFTLPAAADSHQVADSPLPVDFKRAA